MNHVIKLPKQVAFILNELENDGYEAYVVGGCVRDSILNRDIHDWDICTSAKPDEVMEVFNNHHIIPTGLQHGTVTVMIDYIGYEITTYRIDGDYSDSRHPDSVQFTTDIVQDLSRRDFTMNAIAYSPLRGYIDPFEGIVDIHDHIKCVGDPYERFKEDPLRILRAFRFDTQLGIPIESETYIAALDLIDLLDSISAERIQQELLKSLDTKHFSSRFMNQTSIMFKIFPEFKKCYRFDQRNPYHVYDVYQHSIEAVSHVEGKDRITKIAMMLHDIGKPDCCTEDENGVRHFKGHGKKSAEIADSILRRLRFDNYTRESVVELVKYHDAEFVVDKKYIKRWLNRIGEYQFRRLLDIREADVKAQNPAYIQDRVNKVKAIRLQLEEVLEEQSCFSLKDLNISGSDIISLGYVPSPKIGQCLNHLLDNVIDESISNDHESLLKLSKEYMSH